MDIPKLEFPEHLTKHDLSDSDLSRIDPTQHHIAKEWNIIKRQNLWMMEKLVFTHNLSAEHDRQLEFWGKVRWTIALFCGGAITLLHILKTIGFFK